MISIIVPIYNMEKYLVDCVESLINQSTEDEYEILLINDGSIDKSKEICEFYSKKYTNVRVFNKTNGGVSSARNLGLQNTNGTYIMFCDPDDKYEYTTIESIYEIINQGNADMIIWGRKDISNGNVITNYNSHKNTKLISTNNVEYLEKYFSTGKHTFSVCNKVYKMDILKENNIEFNKNLKLSEDTLFNLQYIIKAKTFYEDFRSSYQRNCIEGSTIYKSIDNFYFKNIKFIDIFLNNLSFSEKIEFQEAINKLYFFYGNISIFRIYMNIDGDSFKKKIKIIKSVLNDERFIKGLKNTSGANLKEKCLFALYKYKSATLIYVVFGKISSMWRWLKKYIKQVKLLWVQ